ncbi:hypothetical protein C922_02712 [Plasmodium inui San Antonio 1]|uniref:PNPLA domain-containing protein n=1 Tax=Plasmodium inui San Antonio 1 TaxID=1237626 RepID=W7A0N4_9APIC|nr:hypothetical protein C922_02712 [Plasmodium inui San Antonio 1]EUD66727.1 hypothetical protein C922_02712 [Plasmodium inui San Antonio 1]
MGNSNRRETNKKEDEEEEEADLEKVCEEEPGGDGRRDDRKGRSQAVEVKGKGLLDEGLVNIFFYENYFRNFFNLNEINRFGFTANSTKGVCEVEGDGEDKGTGEETVKIRNKKKIEEMTLHNNKYIVSFLDDTIKSKIEIANFISFYFFFQSVRKNGGTDSVRGKDLSDVNYIYKKVSKSKRYIASDQVETCMRNYLYHIDRRKFPIWKEPLGCDTSGEKDAHRDVGVRGAVSVAEEVRRTSDVGDADTLEKIHPKKRLKRLLSKVKRGRSAKAGEGCPSKWKKNLPRRVKIGEDKVTLRRKSTLGRKYDEGFWLYSSDRNYRRAKRRGMDAVRGKRKDRQEPGEQPQEESDKEPEKQFAEQPEDEAHLRGNVDSAQLTRDRRVPGKGLDSPRESEIGKRKSDNSSYAVYIKKTLTKVFNRYEINRYGLVRRKKKGSMLLGHLLKERKEQMNIGISFSPAGLLIPYHLGVSSLLIEKNILNMHTSIAGSSAGSICACCLGIGLRVDKCFFLIENIISNVYKNGCYQKLQKMLDVELNKYLYSGSYNFLNQRDGSVFVGITQILPYYKRLNITKFYDDSDLINAVIASCNIPMYLSNNIFVNFRNKKCIDGLFSTKKKEFGCPTTKTDRILKVSPFDSDYVGIENKNNSVISPHLVKYRHLIFLFLCVKNLFHRVVDNVWVEKDYAFLVRRLKRIMDLRIFSWGEFLRDYFCSVSVGRSGLDGSGLDGSGLDGSGLEGGHPGGSDFPGEAGPSELMHRLEGKLSRFRCTGENATAKELFLRVNREAITQFHRHKCNYSNFYSFSVTLINVMSVYFEENFSPSTRLRGVVLGGLRQDGADTVREKEGDKRAEKGGNRKGDKKGEQNGENSIEDAQVEKFFLLLEKEQLLRMEQHIQFHPQLESQVILFFFKEHFANESIARLEKRFLKRSIHQLMDALKDICFVDCVERCVRRLVRHRRDGEKGRGDGRFVLSGSMGDYPREDFQPRVRVITHYLKHSQIYKNFIYILNEIKAANGRVLKVSEHNYYSFMCLNGEDLGDSYLFLYLYLYANLCHREMFSHGGGRGGVSGVIGSGGCVFDKSVCQNCIRGNCLCGEITSKPRGKPPPLSEAKNCGEASPWRDILRVDGEFAKRMVQKRDSVTNSSQGARTVSLTQRFSELWTVRKRNGEEGAEEEKNKKNRVKHPDQISHPNHANLFMREEDEMSLGSSPKHYVRRSHSESDNKLEEQKVDESPEGEMCQMYHMRGSEGGQPTGDVNKQRVKSYSFFKKMKSEDLSVGSEPQLNCGHKCQFEKGLPPGLNNLLLFNQGCGVIKNLDEFVKTNWSKIASMNEQRKSEICSHLHEMDQLYRDMLFLQRFGFSINFSEHTKYKFLRKRKKGAVEGEARSAGLAAGLAAGSAAGVEETKWESPTKVALTGQIPSTKEPVMIPGSHRAAGEGQQTTICTSIEEMLVYGSMEMEISGVGKVSTQRIDNKMTEGMPKGPRKSEEHCTRRRRGSDIVSGRSSTKQMPTEVTMHDGSPDNFVDDVETNIDEKLYDNDRTYFVKNVFSIRKLLKMAFEGADDKMIRRIYDMGRSDTYLWLYTEYLNVCIFCFKKVYLLYVKLVSLFDSLLGITSLSRRRRKNDVGAMLSSVEKFVLYVNGKAFNMFELCRLVYVCFGGGGGASGATADTAARTAADTTAAKPAAKAADAGAGTGEGTPPSREDSSPMTVVEAVADVVEPARDAIRRSRFSRCAVHKEGWGEGEKVEAKGEAKREAMEERPEEDKASDASLAKRGRQHIPEGTPTHPLHTHALPHHRHLEDAQAPDAKVCSGHHLSRKGKRGSDRHKREGKGRGKRKENEKIRNPSGEAKENLPHQSSNTGKVMRGFLHPGRVSKTKQKKDMQKGPKERRPRSISLPVDLRKTVLKLHHLKGKIKLNKNIIDGINREILTGTPYEHIYTHSNFWIYSSSDESDGKNLCGNGFYLNSEDATGSWFDSVFDDLSDEADGFSRISTFFRTFRNMDGNLGLSGYFGF